MKKMIATLLCVFPLIAFAENKDVIIKDGVKIMPLSAMNLTEDMKKDVLNIIQEQKVKGYHETNNQSKYIHQLLSIDREKNVKRYNKHSGRGGIDKNYNSVPELDTDFKNNLSEVPLAFSFDYTKWLKSENVIAFAPVGGYIKDKGWTGIKVFFNNESGKCSYSYFDLHRSNMVAELNKETTEYLVNNHPSSKIIEGNVKDGFIYTITWDKKGEMHILDCANKKLDKTIIDKMIALAKKIDSASSVKRDRRNF